MSRNRLALSLLSLALTSLPPMLAPTAQAQTMYKCTGADGKISFSDRPCARGGGGAAVKQEELDVSRTPTEIEKQWPLSERERREMEERCAKGDKVHCAMLEQVRSTTPAQARKNLDNKMRADCQKGDKLACEAAYCDDPTSQACVTKTGRASGTGWVQSDRQYVMSIDDLMTPVRCVPPSQAQKGAQVHCNRSGNACYYDEYKGHGVNERSRNFESLAAAARNLCAR